MAEPRWSVPRRIALAVTAAALVVAAMGLVACSLDPDGGATVPGQRFASTPVKAQVLRSLQAQGYSTDDPDSTYVTYPDLGDATRVQVEGPLYGPTRSKGVLAPYSQVTLTKGKGSSWSVSQSTPAVASTQGK